MYHFGIAAVNAANSSATAGGRGFQNFLVLSQLATGLGLRGMAEQWRYQKMSVELGATMGHLIWQLQDNWPGQSFGLLNYGGEWKQQMHFIRRSFAPLLVTAAGPISTDEGTSVHLISDVMSNTKCEVDVGLWDLSSTSHTPARSWSAAVSVVGGSATKALTILPAQLSMLSHNSSFLRLRASCSGGVEMQNDHFLSTNFSAARDALHEPIFNVSNWGVSNSASTGSLDCTFTLTAAVPALFVVLDAGGYAGRFSDGAFALVPGEERVLSFTPTAAGPDERQPCQIEKLREGFSVTSLHSLLPSLKLSAAAEIRNPAESLKTDDDTLPGKLRAPKEIQLFAVPPPPEPPIPLSELLGDWTHEGDNSTVTVRLAEQEGKPAGGNTSIVFETTCKPCCFKSGTGTVTADGRHFMKVNASSARCVRLAQGWVYGGATNMYLLQLTSVCTYVTCTILV